ncbi:MAG TPA: hypothetical protein VEV13_05340, partial [Candidatus Limnocylindria bacterium]|nr:hypothetical protein [Candidatus Limnocylindria bacterium]
PLRPLGIGEILDGAIQSVRRNPKVMLGLSAVVVSLTSLITFALTWSVLQDLSALDPATASTDDFLGAYASLIGGTIPGTIVGTIAQTILIGVLTVVVGRAALGQTLSIGEAWTLVRPRLVRLLGLSLVATVGTWGLLVLSVGGLVALSVASTLWLLVLLPVAVLPAIFVYVMWWIASPALVLEKAPIFGSLGRSWTLVKGAWWRTFLIVLLTLVLTTVITSVISVPFQLLGGFTTFFTSNPDNPFEISVWGLLVQSIGQIIGLTITYPFTAAVTVLVYIDRRMRVEGLDLELARAASAPGPVGPSAP